MYLDRTKVDFYEKAIEGLDDDGERRILQGKSKLTSMRMVIAMYSKCSCRKGCVLFTVNLSSDKGKDVEDSKFMKRFWF